MKQYLDLVNTVLENGTVIQYVELRVLMNRRRSKGFFYHLGG